ncbi:MAG: N(4)-(beta-N-acetylglucosaminyl)-L-asparaginase [Ignavibacteriales bacterium]|nr:N(4)-(beta-N-acetylglucosaminyl)-L-asparaginase [Ignavibacteriales bacterium]
MHISIRRRDFIKSAAAAGFSAVVGDKLLASESSLPQSKAAVKPVVVSSANGLQATAKAMEMIQQGADALDAIVAGVNIVEDDPKDNSVGYGGIPNEDGVVELDASVMHGPTGRGGAVASIRNIKNPSKVAKLVMERTDHVLIVGEGALRFAKAHGFKEENLLTEESRELWLKWKENLSKDDDWLPPHDFESKDIGEGLKSYIRNYGTINCDAIDLKGNISGCTTTSGLSYKIPGRVGDSPILGAGLYVDNEFGAAGSTGRGEANLLSCSSVMIVEYMSQGKSPEQACIMACERIARQTKEKRLIDEKGRPKFDVRFYALNKKGDFGSASIWSGGKFAVNTGEKQSRLAESAYLYKREPRASN